MDLLSEALQWAVASKTQQDEVVDTLLSNLKGFEIVYENNYCLERPIRIIYISDAATKIVFNIIPGSTFTMGLSQAEEQALKALAVKVQDDEPEAASWVHNLLDRQNWLPAHQVKIAPFLLARFPLSWM